MSESKAEREPAVYYIVAVEINGELWEPTVWNSEEVASEHLAELDRDDEHEPGVITVVTKADYDAVVERAETAEHTTTVQWHGLHAAETFLAAIDTELGLLDVDQAGKDQLRRRINDATEAIRAATCEPKRRALIKQEFEIEHLQQQLSAERSAHAETQTKLREAEAGAAAYLSDIEAKLAAVRSAIEDGRLKWHDGRIRESAWFGWHGEAELLIKLRETLQSRSGAALLAELDRKTNLLKEVYRQAGNGAPGIKRHALTPNLRDSIRDEIYAQPQPKQSPAAAGRRSK